MRESRLADRHDERLRLPVPPEPPLAPPAATVELMLAASAEMLPLWNADPENEARRLARKSRQRFSLVLPRAD